MQNTSRLAALLLLPLAFEVPTLEYAPDEHSSWSKTFEDSVALELLDVSVVVDGSDLGALIGELEMELETQLSVSIEDEIRAADDGRVLQLAREFDSIELESEVYVSAGGQSDTTETSGSSPLDGKTVVFTWDDEDELYAVAWDEDEGGDEALLERLAFETDGQALLPEGDVEQDDTWSVDPTVVMDLLWPGGDLALEAQGAEEIEGIDMERVAELMADLNRRTLEQAAEMYDGDVTCTLLGLREVSETPVAVIGVEVDIRVEGDFGSLFEEFFAALLEVFDAPGDIELSGSLELDGSIGGEAELLWNTRDDVLHGFSSELDMDFDISLDVDVDAQGESHAVEAEMTLSGTHTRSLSAD